MGGGDQSRGRTGRLPAEEVRLQRILLIIHRWHRGALLWALGGYLFPRCGAAGLAGRQDAEKVCGTSKQEQSHTRSGKWLDFFFLLLRETTAQFTQEPEGETQTILRCPFNKSVPTCTHHIAASACSGRTFITGTAAIQALHTDMNSDMLYSLRTHSTSGVPAVVCGCLGMAQALLQTRARDVWVFVGVFMTTGSGSIDI